MVFILKLGRGPKSKPKPGFMLTVGHNSEQLIGADGAGEATLYWTHLRADTPLTLNNAAPCIEKRGGL